MNEKILEEILENTKTVKSVIVDKVEAEEKKKAEKKEKAKSAQQKAESKFKNVGAKFNQEEQSNIDERIKELNTNQSQYIKKLVEADLITKTVSLDEMVKEDKKEPESLLNDMVKSYELKLEEVKSELYICETKYVTEIEKVKRLENEKKELVNRLNSFNQFSVFQKIKYVISGKKV